MVRATHEWPVFVQISQRVRPDSGPVQNFILRAAEVPLSSRFRCPAACGGDSFGIRTHVVPLVTNLQSVEL